MKAVLLTLERSGSGWDHKDAELTEQLRDQYGSQADEITAKIKRLPKGVRNKLAAPGRKASEAVANVSFPWPFRNATFLVPCVKLQNARDAVDAARAELIALLDEVEATMPEIEAERRAALNGAFSESRMPTMDEIRGRYDIRHSIDPVPRAQLDEITEALGVDAIELSAKLEREIAERLEAAHKEAHKSLYTRLLDPLSRIIAKMEAIEKGEQSICHSSLTEHAADAAKIVSELNDGIIDDPAIADFVKKVAAIGMFPAVTLNGDGAKPVRIMVKQQVAGLADAMQKAMATI